MILDKKIQYILDTLNKYGYQAYLVGGCVRDSLLNKTYTDIDISTNAHPQVVLSLFSNAMPTGMKQGTITLNVEGEEVEVTTFRKESNYKDHRHPESVEFVSTIEEDLKRRDFTMNAIAYHPKTGFVDPFDGIKDIKNKQIRCVKDPNQCFEEDALRILRAYRFCAKLGFQMEEKTKQAMEKRKKDLKYISNERIVQELTEILRYNPYIIEQMTDLLGDWMPELEEAKKCEQNSRWHDSNVLHHSLRAVSYLKPFDSTLAWTLLMHDFGKMQAKETVDGVDHFKGHPEISADIAQEYSKKIGFKKKDRDRMIQLIKYHDSSLSCSKKNIYNLCVSSQLDDMHMQNLFIIKRCDLLAHSILGRKTIHRLNKFIEYYDAFRKSHPLSLRELCIDGNDIKENTDLKQKQVHSALNDCLKACIYEEVENDRQALIAYIKRFKQKWKDDKK